MMRFHVFLCLWSVTSCLCVYKICKVAKIKVSNPKIYSLSKSRLPKRLIQTRPHMATSRRGKICITPPKRIRNERRHNFYLCCNIVVAAAMSWRLCVIRCESESTLFGLPNDYTTKNRWLIYIYNTIPEQYNANIWVCAAHFMEDCFLIMGESSLQCVLWMAVNTIKWGNSNVARTVWCFWFTACKYVSIFKEFATDYSNASFEQRIE